MQEVKMRRSYRFSVGGLRALCVS